MMLQTATSRMADGPMGQTVAMSDDHRRNRERFVAAQCGRNAARSVMVESVHGCDIQMVTLAEAGCAMPECDGLLTTTPNLPLMVTHQDCVPIVITNAAADFVCVLHAGWRGVVAGILPKALRLIETTVPNGTSVSIALGPCLQSCHFEVQEDVASQFRVIASESVIVREGKLFVDMHAALRRQAIAAGVSSEHITTSHECTFCSFGYFSWRRDGIRENNLVTVAMLRP